MAIALEALPDEASGIERPYVAAAEASLFTSYHRAQEVAVLAKDDGRVSDAAFSPDGRRVLAIIGGKASLWDGVSGRETAVLNGQEGEVASAAFSADGARVVTVSSDGTACIWSTEMAEVIATLRTTGEAIVGAGFSADGRAVITVGERTARFWEVQSGSETAILGEHHSGTYLGVVGPDAVCLATVATSAGREEESDRWEMERARSPRPTGWGPNSLVISEKEQAFAFLQAHTDKVTSATFSPDGRYIATTSLDGTALLVDIGARKSLAVLLLHTVARPGVLLTSSPSASSDSIGKRLGFSADSQRLVVPKDNTARILETATAKEIAVIGTHGDRVNSASFSPDGRRILTASWDGTARIWDVETGQEVNILAGHATCVTSAAFGPDGQRVVTVSLDGTARLWNLDARTDGSDADTERSWLGLNQPDPEYRPTRFGRQDGTIWLDGVALPADLKMRAEINLVRQSNDGRLLFAGSLDGSAQLWDLQKNSLISALTVGEAVWHGAFSPDGSRFVSVSRHLWYLWDTETGKNIGSLEWWGDLAPAAVLFSPDSLRVLTASHRAVRIWDAKTGGRIAELAAPKDGRFAEISEDFRYVSGAVGDTRRVWRIFPTVQDLVDQAKIVIPRSLTRKQRENAHLDAEPPIWCVEREKWPYHTLEWKKWLQHKRANLSPPLPDTPEWHPWLKAQRSAGRD